MSDLSEHPDAAAIFAGAMSLWKACHERYPPNSERAPGKIFNGTDEFMRVVMEVAGRFEDWACRHVDFGELVERRPYLIEHSFGAHCVFVVGVTNLLQFDDRSCLRIALRLGLPLKATEHLPVPMDASAPNPVVDSAFPTFRIQTVRRIAGTDSYEPFTVDDDPFDERFDAPEFALYGIAEDGLLEHIADRHSLRDAVDLAEKIAPGVRFTNNRYLRRRD